MKERKIYNRIKRQITLLDLLLTVVLLAYFAFSGTSENLAGVVEFYTENIYIQFTLFYLVVSVIFFMATLPLDFYSSFIVEHDFGLSNQSIFRWCSEKVKGIILGGLIGIPLVLVFYLFLQKTGVYWWLYFGGFYILFSLLLSVIAPVIILPLFYKSTPLQNQELVQKLSGLAVSQGISVREIKSFDLSKNTKKVNAALTGLGKTKTILLADTLVSSFSLDEIFSVFAHEMGHYKRRHITKNILINSIFTMIALFCCSWGYTLCADALGYKSITQLSALPLLVFFITVFSLLLMPLMNSISRTFEYEADAYAVKHAGADSFTSALRKISQINLSDEDAPALYEYIFFSHPPVSKRIAAAEAKK